MSGFSFSSSCLLLIRMIFQTRLHKPLFSYISVKNTREVFFMKFPIFLFQHWKEKFSSHISSFALENRPAIKDFPLRRRVPLLFFAPVLSGRFCPGDRSPFFTPESSFAIYQTALGTQLPGGRSTSCRNVDQELASYNAYFGMIPRRKYRYPLLTMKCAIHRCFLMH